MINTLRALWQTWFPAARQAPRTPAEMKERLFREHGKVVLGAIIRHPERQHYVATASLSEAQDFARRLREFGIGPVICAKASSLVVDDVYTMDWRTARSRMESGEAHVLIACADLMAVGWRTARAAEMHLLCRVKPDMETQLMWRVPQTREQVEAGVCA